MMDCDHDWRVQLGRFVWQCPKCGAVSDFKMGEIFKSLDEYNSVIKSYVFYHYKESYQFLEEHLDNLIF